MFSEKAKCEKQDKISFSFSSEISFSLAAYSEFLYLLFSLSHSLTQTNALTLTYTHTHKTPFLQPPPDCFPWKIKFSFTDDLYRRLLTLLNIIPKENMSRILGREVAFPCSYRSTYLYLDAHFIPISYKLLLTL